jgi:signal recognition particle subunit SRP54
MPGMPGMGGGKRGKGKQAKKGKSKRASGNPAKRAQQEKAAQARQDGQGEPANGANPFGAADAAQPSAAQDFQLPADFEKYLPKQ